MLWLQNLQPLTLAADDARLATRMRAMDNSRIEELPDRVERLEQKIDALAGSVDARFNAVDVAFVEQRQYTEFAFETVRGELETLRGEVKVGFTQTQANFQRIERKLEQLIDAQSNNKRTPNP